MSYQSTKKTQRISHKDLLLMPALLLLLCSLLVPIKTSAASVNPSKVINPNTETLTSTIINNSKVDLNTATIDELEALPYIGTKRAAAIVAFRKANGGFDSVEQLQQLSNISALTANKLEKHVFVEKNVKSDMPKMATKEHNNH